MVCQKLYPNEVGMMHKSKGQYIDKAPSLHLFHTTVRKCMGVFLNVPQVHQPLLAVHGCSLVLYSLFAWILPRFIRYQTTFLFFSFDQLWTVALWLTQSMARLLTLEEQHLNRPPPTVVILATSWWETTIVHVKLQACGLGVNPSVRVCCNSY